MYNVKSIDNFDAFLLKKNLINITVIIATK